MRPSKPPICPRPLLSVHCVKALDTLLAARLQMSLSLGFHIVFACIGMIMPFFMSITEYKWLKTRDETYLQLARSWSRGVAVFFAVGAVSGTVLSFELGLLWPNFMLQAGPIIGMPFSYEGTFFFLEAIFLGLFLYGWDRIKPWWHWFFGLMVGVMGIGSGIIVVAANAWMNSPSGFDWVGGKAIHIDPVQAFFNDAWGPEALHMTLAALMATGMAVGGLHAWLLLRKKAVSFHQKALKITVPLTFLAALLMPFSGDLSARAIAKRQPEKLAAMEAQFHTEFGAGLLIGGIPNLEEQRVSLGLEIPGLLSWLTHGKRSAAVLGLDAFPEEDRPPVVITHLAFQLMIGIGTLSFGLALFYFFERLIRKRDLSGSKIWLRALSTLIPVGFLALEAGWTVTEVGRQPWIIYKIMRTRDAVTPMPGIGVSLLLYTSVYLALTIVICVLMRRQIILANQRYS